MKLVTAVVREEKLDELIDAVIGIGARGLTVTQVRGFGQQLGQLAAHQTAAGLTRAGVADGPQGALLPKVRLDLVVADQDAQTTVEAIAKCAGTGTIGDGKIWVSPVDSALRVRTGERDRNAI